MDSERPWVSPIFSDKVGWCLTFEAVMGESVAQRMLPSDSDLLIDGLQIFESDLISCFSRKVRFTILK